MTVDLDECVILITGAASGIGRSLATGLNDRGAHVVVGVRNPEGRNREAVRDLSLLNIDYVDCDVKDDQSVEAAVNHVVDHHQRIDVVINNAGVAIRGPMEAATLDDLYESFETNVFGAHRVARAVLPHMRARSQGLILQISSSAARWVQPGNGVYAASKWALEAISEAMRWELGGFGVDCCLVELGAYRSELLRRNKLTVSDVERSAEYAEVARAQQADAESRILGTGSSPASPHELVAPIADIIQTPRGRRPLRTVVHSHKAALDYYNDVQTALTAAVFADRGYSAFVQNGLIYSNNSSRPGFRSCLS